MSEIRTPTLLDYGKLMTLGIVWGSAFICIKIALESFEPFTLAGVRSLMAGLFLLCISLAMRVPWPRGGKNWRDIAIVGVFNGVVPFLLIAWGQQFVPANLTAILMGTGPLAALLMGHLFTQDDRMTWGKVLGMILGFSGMLVLIGAEALSGLGVALAGQLAIAGAAVSYAISGLLTRRIVHLNGSSSSTLMALMASALLLPLGFLTEDPFATVPTQEAVLSLLFLGLVSSGMAYLLRFQIIRDNGSVFMSQVSYLIPLSGVFLAWIILDERLAAEAWTALALILAGIACTRLKAFKGA